MEFNKKELNKNKTKFIPVDSEHFSLWYGLKNSNNEDIENFYYCFWGSILQNSIE